MKFAKLFNINIGDLGRGFIVTLITAALTVLYQSIADGAIPALPQLKTALLVGVGAGISYLIKNLLTGVPKSVEVDVTKTIVVDATSKQVLVDAVEKDNLTNNKN